MLMYVSQTQSVPHSVVHVYRSLLQGPYQMFGVLADVALLSELVH